jgi:hypothetical protein
MNESSDIQRNSALSLFASAKGLDLYFDKDKEKLEEQIKHILNINLVDASLDNPLSVRNLNVQIISVASTLHSHNFKSYTKEEAKSALKFLEIFSLLGFYKNQLFHLTEIGLQGKFKDKDPLIEKSIYYAEKIRDKLDSKKIDRESLKLEIKHLKKEINKIFSRRLDSIDQIALQKYLKKALSILKSYIKS